MTKQQRNQAFAALARELPGLDTPVYEEYEQDPLAPVLGMGNRKCRVAFFGRDPGRDEVRHQMPFIGAGGQKVRGTIYRHLHKEEMPDFAASVKMGKLFYWANTVPYKPVGNKAWSMKIKKQFQPLVADLLLTDWQGGDIITLGREAFFWFAINRERELKQAMEAFWEQDDRFTTHFSMELRSESGKSRPLRLHPLPHPSPLNATWYKRFPELLEQRLAALGVSLEDWQIK